MAPDKSKGSIQTSIQNKIATISFGHPAGNSFPSALLKLLTDEIDVLGQNPEAVIILLKSEGSGPFCAGASFDELLEISDLEDGTRFFTGFANLINAMRRCPKLIIGRIHGKAVGGGVGIISACDYTMASKNASIKLSELTIGIGPFVIEPAVSRKIGKMAMTEMTLAANDWKDAVWAKQKGMFAEVFETVGELDAALEKYCQNLVSFNPDALSEMKKVLWENTENWDTLLYERAAISGKLVLSDFTKKALSEFKK
jgi:methylglutaconyl-CoA hydratase